MDFMIQLSDPSVKTRKLGTGLPKKFLKERELKRKQEEEAEEEEEV